MVVSTDLKNISQNGNLSPGREENKKYSKPPPSSGLLVSLDLENTRNLQVSLCPSRGWEQVVWCFSFQEGLS